MRLFIYVSNPKNSNFGVSYVTNLLEYVQQAYESKKRGFWHFRVRSDVSQIYGEGIHAINEVTSDAAIQFLARWRSVNPLFSNHANGVTLKLVIVEISQQVNIITQYLLD